MKKNMHKSNCLNRAETTCQQDGKKIFRRGNILHLKGIRTFWNCGILCILLLQMLFLPKLFAGVDLCGYGQVYPFDVKETSAVWGGTIKVRFDVVNYGDTTAKAFKVGLYLSRNTIIGDEDDWRFCDIPCGALPPFTDGVMWGYYIGTDYIDIPLPVINPFDGKPTTFYVGMIIDPDNEIAETNKANNKNLGGGKDRDNTPITIPNPVPNIFATYSAGPSSEGVLPFGDVVNDGPGNACGIQKITLINKGEGTLNIKSIVLSGSSDFTITEIVSSIQKFIQVASLPRVLAENETEAWIIALQYDPCSDGIANGTLIIESDDPDTPELVIKLTGNGIPVPCIARADDNEASEVDFGGVVQDGKGGFQSTRTISIKNVGTGSLKIKQKGVTLLQNKHYRIISIKSTTRGNINLENSSSTISPNGSEVWNMEVCFDPSEYGRLVDELQVLPDDSNKLEYLIPTYSVSLTGLGQKPMSLAVENELDTSVQKLTFKDTYADGSGLEQSTETLYLKNKGEAPLTVDKNGIILSSGRQFKIKDVVSNKQGNINLSSSSATISGNNNETWAITLVFDPSTGDNLTDTLTIKNNDPKASNYTVSLTGKGLDQPGLLASDEIVDFGYVLNDGIGGNVAQKQIKLKNVGTQPLSISRNGISLTGEKAFSILSVISSTRGSINLANSNTIAAKQSEVWTVTVGFDPTSNSEVKGYMQIGSNDPRGTHSISLSGCGDTPTIALKTPSDSINVSVGSVFEFLWDSHYSVGDAQVSLKLVNQNGSGEEVEIVRGLSLNSSDGKYTWRVNANAVGGRYRVVASISDGSVMNSSSSSGILTIDSRGAFVLRSPVEVTSSDYAYEYEYKGEVYTGVYTLPHEGYNTLTVSNELPDGTTATFQFGVNLVPSLIHTERASYDELNRVVETKNGNGITTTFTYDTLGRLEKQTSSNGSVVEFEYDVLGRRTVMRDYTGTTLYGWDDLDRLVSVTTKGSFGELTLKYEYDLAGRKTAMVYPSGERIEYRYDNSGRLIIVENVTRKLQFKYEYDADTGLLARLIRPNKIETLFAYDGMGRVTNICHQTTGGSLEANYGYILDAAGKATEFHTKEPGNIHRVERYSYDRFDRIEKVIYSEDTTIDRNDKTVSYSYDGNGNRTCMETKVNNVITEVRHYQYGNENRLLSVTNEQGAVLASYSYDAAGNMIKESDEKGTRFFGYDERNLLISLSDGSNYIVYSYNGDGQRVAKTVNGKTAWFVNDINRNFYETVEEWDGRNRNASFTLSGGRLSSYENGQLRFELLDRLSSVRKIVNNNGAALANCEYDIFGTSDSDISTRYSFAGEYLDQESGFIFLRARFYDPETGRFISKDPLGISAGLNGYLYCGNNPINMSDPSGFYAGVDDVFAIGIGVVGGVGGQLFEDMVFNNGEISHWSEYMGAAVGGGIQGWGTWNAAALGPMTPLVTGVGSAVVDDLVAQGCAMASGYQDSFSLDKLTEDTASGVLGGIIGIDAPMNSTVKMLNTKLSKGSIHNLSVSSVKKIADHMFEQAVADITTSFFNSVVVKACKEVSEIIIDAGKNMINSINEGINNTSTSSSSLVLTGRVEYNDYSSLPVGGVLLDKAAQLVGSNLSDIKGAMYDPVSRQFVFLGSDNSSSTVKDMDLDYLWTALSAVYGSAVPPFVTLDPPAQAYTGWQDYGDGDGIFEPGEEGGFIFRYTPIWSEEDTTNDTTIDVKIRGTWNGVKQEWIARLKCFWGHIISNGNRENVVGFVSWISAPPAGITLDLRPWQSTESTAMVVS